MDELSMNLKINRRPSRYNDILMGNYYFSFRHTHFHGMHGIITVWWRFVIKSKNLLREKCLMDLVGLIGFFFLNAETNLNLVSVCVELKLVMNRLNRKGKIKKNFV